MRFVLVLLAFALSGHATANTYHCGVDNVVTNDGYPNLIVVTLLCPAPDAMTTGQNCSGTISPRSFVFDSSTNTG